jgi:hypothetical protein
MEERMFADDPAAFFGRDPFAAHRIERAELERLQLAALQSRFESLKGRVRALDALAHETGVREVVSLDQALPLFIPHAVYKSYPEDYLLQRRFDLLTEWLQAFTTCDLEPVRRTRYETIDDWLDGLDALTGLRVCHSSGTLGKLSFFPRGAEDFDASRDLYKMNLAQWFDSEAKKSREYDFAVIHLASCQGKAWVGRSASHIRSMIVPPGAMYTLDDRPVSVDLQYFVARTQDAMRRGTTVGMEASAYIAARLEEQNARPANRAEDYRRLHDLLVGPLAGQFTMVIGGTPMIWAFAREGLKLGGKHVLERGGGHMTMGGGLKGQALPEGWMADLHRYFGRTSVNQAYGMTELISGLYQCPAGRYHCPPWIVPFALDRDSGRPLPREGAQSGRGAFFDLVPRTHWGGVVSADLLTLSWEPCACGRSSPHIAADIARQLDGSDDGLTCAAPREAIDALIEQCVRA